MSSESGIVTTTMLSMKDQRNIQNFRFQFCIFPIRTEHKKNVLCKRKSPLWIADK